MSNFDYDKVYRQYYSFIYYLCLQYLNFHEADAKDTAQNVFFLLYQNKDKIPDETKVRAWLLSTTKRQCLRLVRKHATDNKYISKESDITDLPESVQVSDNNEIIDNILNQYLDEDFYTYQNIVTDRLSEKEKQLILFIKQKKKYSELAEELHTSPAAVAMSVMRLRRKIESIIREILSSLSALGFMSSIISLLVSHFLS